MFPEPSTPTALLAPAGSEPTLTFTVLPGWKPVPLAVTVDPGEAVQRLNEGLGAAGPPVGFTVKVAVEEGPRTASSSARTMSAHAPTIAGRLRHEFLERGRLQE
jgi:hypothetical protein